MNNEGRSGRCDRPKRSSAVACSRPRLPYLTMGALLLIAVFVLGRGFDRHIGAVELWIANLGPWSLLVFVGLFVLATSLLLPEAVLAVVAGALFGVTWGLAAVLVGNLLAAAIQFQLSRRLLRARIQQALASKPTLAAIQQAVRRDAFRLQVLLRLAPLNPATVSYLLGAAGVRFSKFLLACLALTPYLLMEVSFGHAGERVARMAGPAAGGSYLHALAAFGGFGACLVVLIFLARMAYRAVLEAAADRENADSE